MVKFFRKIRQKLLSENRISKYLFYAIGEIALVVIGILIALQVNNLNEMSKRVKAEKEILKEVLINLKQDSATIVEHINWHDGISMSSDYIIKTIENRVTWNDTMKVHYGRLLRYGQVTFITSGYENLKSIGFDLISNDSIRVGLTFLHGVIHKSILRYENDLLSDYQKFYLAPLFLKRLEMEDPFGIGTPHEYDEILDDREFLQAIRWKKRTIDGVSIEYEHGLKKTNKLIVMIENELKE